MKLKKLFSFLAFWNFNKKPAGSSREKSELEMVSDYLSSEKNKAEILHLASEIQVLMGDNWFTYLAYQRKAKILTHELAFKKLKALELFGFSKMKMGESHNGKNAFRCPMFKITIDKKHKIDAIDDIVKYHQAEIDKLQADRKNLAASKK